MYRRLNQINRRFTAEAADLEREHSAIIYHSAGAALASQHHFLCIYFFHIQEHLTRIIKQIQFPLMQFHSRWVIFLMRREDGTRVARETMQPPTSKVVSMNNSRSSCWRLSLQQVSCSSSSRLQSLLCHQMLKAATCWFSTFPHTFDLKFLDSLTRSEDDTPDIDTAPPPGLISSGKMQVPLLRYRRFFFFASLSLFLV